MARQGKSSEKPEAQVIYFEPGTGPVIEPGQPLEEQPDTELSESDGWTRIVTAQRVGIGTDISGSAIWQAVLTGKPVSVNHRARETPSADNDQDSSEDS